MRKIQIAGYGLESAELPEDAEVLVQEGENLEEATEALEAFALLMQPAVEGYTVNPAALAAVSTVTNRLVRKAGLPTLSVGTESVVVDTVQQAASLGLEDIKEHLKNAAKAVIDFIKKISKWIVEKIGAMWDAAVNSLTKTKNAIVNAASDAYNRKKLIDVSLFNINGKLNGTTVGASLKWATSKEGVEAVMGDYVEWAFGVGDFAGRADKYDPDSEEVRDLLVKFAEDTKTKFLKGIKFDSDGFVTNYPSRMPIKMQIVKNDSGPVIQTETERGEPKKVETTLEKVGITKDVADKIADNIDMLNQLIKAGIVSQKSFEKNALKAAQAGGLSDKETKLTLKAVKVLFQMIQFQATVARNLVAAINEIGRVVKAGNSGHEESSTGVAVV